MGASGVSTLYSNMLSNYDVFYELIDNEELLKQQYDLVAGSWPTNANELVLNVSTNNEISDYTLYSLGILSQDDLKEQFNKVDNKNYKALLAIRQKEGVNTDKEHMKLLWFEGELKTKEEAIAVMEENFPNWCDGYNYIAILLSSYQDFLKEIKK